ncbi:MAG: outer membrane beta-barrel protein [Geothrix sp.]|jgi:opacity protein-like surface antigen|nr:outer membrane beta-barrel protein [Geothrix sp.]
MNFRALALAVAALAAPALNAQEAVRFGVQAGLNLPQSDLKDAVDSKLGYNLGVQVTFDLRGGHMLRPRYDYTWFPEYTESFAGDSFSTKFIRKSLGVDYLYFVDGKPQGFYVTAGIAAVQWAVEVNFTLSGLGSGSNSQTSNKLALAAGAGYQFNRTVGADLRYIKGKAWEGDLDMVQAGVSVRF